MRRVIAVPVVFHAICGELLSLKLRDSLSPLVKRWGIFMDMLEATKATLDRMAAISREGAETLEALDENAINAELIRLSLAASMRGQMVLFQQMSIVCQMLDAVRQGRQISPAPSR